MTATAKPESYLDRIAVFDSITVSRPVVAPRRISGNITLDRNGRRQTFELIFSYREDVIVDENMAGLILTMPAINFTLFARELVLEFPVSRQDVAELRRFIDINNTEVFVNKLCRRRYEFYLSDFLPGDEDITAGNARGLTKIRADLCSDDMIASRTSSHGRNIAVLSSGGKESLLTYGLLQKIGMNTFPIFFNESGAHWRAAKTSFEHLSRQNSNTTKVWSNVDRFYRFCLRNLPILDPVMLSAKADVYPVQLFIFPVYIFSILPLAIKHGISMLVMGNEFDDPRDMPLYRGISHYYEIYDQTWDFAREVSRYLEEKGINTSVSSILYPVTPTIVERMLVRDFPDLFRLQRSCHSCSVVSGKVVPCGKCSKCKGVIMLILAAGADPRVVGYAQEDKDEARKSRAGLRLDSSELDYLYGGCPSGTHITGLHQFPDESESLSRLPEELRGRVRHLFEASTDGRYTLSADSWKRT